MGSLVWRNKYTYRWFVLGPGLGIPILVGLLMTFSSDTLESKWIDLLPHVHASTNLLSTCVLIFALYAIRIKQNPLLHRKAMSLAWILGLIFLISYTIYHAGAAETKYGDLNADGILSGEEKKIAPLRPVYYLMLISHILLAIPLPYLVQTCFYHALCENFERHKFWVKYTYPLWLYVSVSGVLIYLMIRPYYN
ncbi:MAG: DUF420 domain-containing protein [Cytophagales bacterium]|nr:DUF420 domain-containing protein [Cytophagales bacterium]